MKRFLVILFLLVTFKGVAQEGFHIGADVGLNTVWITHQDDYGQVGILHVLDYGVAPSLTLGYNFKPNMGLQIDFIYSFQGGKYQQTLKNNTLTRQLDLNYFKVPLYFKYSYTNSDVKNVKFFVMGGPQIGLLQSASITSDYLEAPYVGNDEKYRFESTEIELAGQAGADIYVNANIYFELGIRVDYGLTDMNAPAYRIPSNGSPYSAGSNATGGLILGINYMFNKKN